MVRYSHHHLWIAYRRVIDKLAITKSASTPDGVAQIKIEEFKMNFSNNKSNFWVRRAFKFKFIWALPVGKRIL